MRVEIGRRAIQPIGPELPDFRLDFGDRPQGVVPPPGQQIQHSKLGLPPLDFVGPNGRRRRRGQRLFERTNRRGEHHLPLPAGRFVADHIRRAAVRSPAGSEIFALSGDGASRLFVAECFAFAAGTVVVWRNGWSCGGDTSACRGLIRVSRGATSRCAAAGGADHVRFWPPSWRSSRETSRQFAAAAPAAHRHVLAQSSFVLPRQRPLLATLHNEFLQPVVFGGDRLRH